MKLKQRKHKGLKTRGREQGGKHGKGKVKKNNYSKSVD